LNHLVPVFLKILDGNPVFISTSPEQVSTSFILAAIRLMLHSGYGTASSRFSTDFL
jgi:hypothetical protein